MKSYLLLLAVIAVPVPLVGQSPTLPEQLMIGPEEYVKAPHAFPVILAETATRFDSIRARNLAPRDWGLANVQACRPVALVDTARWQRDNGVLLPAGFAPDSSFRSYHGGLRWRAGELALTVENGWWGVGYDSAGYLTSCLVETRSGTYLVNQARTPTGFAFRAVPFDREWRPSSAILGHAPTEEEIRILWTAFMTMSPPRCRYMTGGPVIDPSAPPC
jgi:hypothetical protein